MEFLANLARWHHARILRADIGCIEAGEEIRIVGPRAAVQVAFSKAGCRRIAFVISSMGAGGAERVAGLLVNEWSDKGNDVTLLTFFPESTDFHSASGRVRRMVLGKVAEGMGLMHRADRLLSRLRDVRAALRALRPDVVVSFGHSTNVVVLAAAAGLGVPVIVSERSDPGLAPMPWLVRRIRPLMYRHAARIVVQSTAVRNWAEQTVPNTAVSIIPNPVLRPGVPSDIQKCKRIVGLGRLIPSKGFDLLIRAFAQHAAAYPAWSLLICGEGPERPRLEALVRELGLQGRVEFAGLIRNPATTLAASEIFVLASHFEGFPNALLEAMACGLAVISFDCPSGPGEIIRHGHDGMLVPVGDTAMLAETLADLMANDDLRGRLSRNATAVVEKYGISTIAGMWDELICSLTR